MKTFSKAVSAVICVVLMLALCACAPACNSEEVPFSDGNNFFNNASPETSVLMFYVYDGENGQYSWISNADTSRAILKELGEVDVRKAADWNPDKLKGKIIYGISIGSGDVLDVQGSWCDGYWIASDGYAYEFDYDFKKLEKNYNWENPQKFRGIAYMPNARWMTEYKMEWYKSVMTSAPEHSAPANVTMEMISHEDGKIKVKLINSGDDEWMYGEYYSLEVKLNGKWYAVPTMPGNWGFHDIGYILNAGAEAEMEYNLAMYGDLPVGDYRVVVEEMTAEFTEKT